MYKHSGAAPLRLLSYLDLNQHHFTQTSADLRQIWRGLQHTEDLANVPALQLVLQSAVCCLCLLTTPVSQESATGINAEVAQAEAVVTDVYAVVRIASIAAAPRRRRRLLLVVVIVCSMQMAISSQS